MSRSGFGRVMFGVAAVVLASGAARADKPISPGYRCTATDFRYTQEKRDGDSRDRWVTRIGFTKDGKLTWSVDAKWDHPDEGFVARGSTSVTLDGFGLYARDSGHAEQIGEDFPSIQFEPLNYGVYPKMRGLITPVTADVYRGCPEEPPPEPSEEPPVEPPVVPTVTKPPFTVHACSNLQLPIFGGAVAMPSVPRYPDRTFCAFFDFSPPLTVDGIVAPATSDAVFSPVDFVDLSRTGPAKTCRFSKSTCSTSASCEPNPCVPDPEIAGTTTCALGKSTLKSGSACVTDGDCAPDQCEFPTQQRPGDGVLYGIRLTVVTSGSVEVGDEQRLAALVERMWDRRSDATARGVVYSEVLSERRIGDAKVERTLLYLFELTAGSPLTFITRWD